jgi:hypothetical protein
MDTPLEYKPENYRGFTAHFANEFVLPQIAFWRQNVFKRPEGVRDIEKEYFDGMERAVLSIRDSLSGPGHRHGFVTPHEYVLSINEVEILKGLLGDNYNFHKDRLEQKKRMDPRFMDTSKEEKAIEEMDLVFAHIAAGLADSKDKKLFAPLKEFQKEEADQEKQYDVFLCHASEDKSFVEPLAQALKAAGIKVWYDNFRLDWGDNLRPSIDRGLASSRYGIVIFSKAFLGKKKWTEHELNGLFAKEGEEKVILPIWHNITREDVLPYSPSLADRLAIKTAELSIDQIVEKVKNVLDLKTSEIIPQRVASEAKQQIKEGVESETARRLYRAVLKVRDAMSYVRAPWIPLAEMEAAAAKYPKADPATTNAVYHMRWEQMTEAMTELQSEQVEAEVLWGDEVVKKIQPLRSCVGKLNANLSEFLRPHEDRARSRKDLGEIIYEMRTEKETDTFSKEIDAAVKTVGDFLKPKYGAQQ